VRSTLADDILALCKEEFDGAMETFSDEQHEVEMAIMSKLTA